MITHTEAKTNELRFEIADCPTYVDPFCDVCGRREAADYLCLRLQNTPPLPFAAHTGFVCQGCGKRLAPDLYARLEKENQLIFEDQHKDDPGYEDFMRDRKDAAAFFEDKPKSEMSDETRDTFTQLSEILRGFLVDMWRCNGEDLSIYLDAAKRLEQFEAPLIAKRPLPDWVKGDTRMSLLTFKQASPARLGERS
ncbi:MAG: hypothetical protein ISS70_08150 [Phycisphaerae bacterium]|nr:hypothetical protein [Phycisphaerae bacterium]